MDTKKIFQVVLTLVAVGSLALMAGSILSASDETTIRRPAASPSTNPPPAPPPAAEEPLPAPQPSS